MRSDSPGPEWYEPPDLVDDDHEAEPAVGDQLVIAAGIVSWTAGPTDDD